MVTLHNGQGQPVPADLLLKAQIGDAESREAVILAFQPYVVRIASNYCGRFLRQGIDEEISVALLALNEAIDHFRPESGSAFSGFVHVVVKRRLIDYYRRNKSRQLEIPFSDFTDAEGGDSPALNLAEQKEAEKVFVHQQETRDRKEEIIYYTRLLSEYGITLPELLKCSPKHKSARLRAVTAARMIAGDQLLVRSFLRHKELPLKEIENNLPFSRKTLERHRKYIVALLLVCIEDLPHIREYLKGDMGE